MPVPNVEKIRISKTVALPGDLLSVVCEPNSERLWIGHIDFKIYSIDFGVEKPAAAAVFEGHTSYVSGLGLIDGALVSAGWDKKLIWWDLKERKQIRTVDAHKLWIRQLSVNPARSTLASVSDDMTCKLWDAKSGQMVRSLTGFDEKLPRYDYPNKIYACAFSPDGRHVAAADEACRVIVWETESGRESARFDALGFFKADWDRNNHPYGGIRSMTFSPDGRSLAMAGMENTDVAIINGKALVQSFDWQSGKKTYEQKLGSNSQFECLYFHPQSAWMLTAVGGSVSGGAMYFLDPAQPKVLKETLATMPTFALAVNQTADVIYTVGRGKAIKWDFAA